MTGFRFKLTLILNIFNELCHPNLFGLFTASFGVAKVEKIFRFQTGSLKKIKKYQKIKTRGQTDS